MEETGALNDPTDDVILQSLRPAGLDHLLEEVRRVLDSTSNLLVSQSGPQWPEFGGTECH